VTELLDWSDVTFTIDGQPISFTNAEWSCKAEPERAPLVSKTYEATIETTIPGSPPDFAALFREPPGASAATLAKRVKYGGRKGRSAWRRLLKRAPEVVLSTGLVRLRGRAAMLDETEILVRMSGRSGRGRR